MFDISPGRSADGFPSVAYDRPYGDHRLSAGLGQWQSGEVVRPHLAVAAYFRAFDRKINLGKTIRFPKIFDAGGELVDVVR